MIDLIEKTHTDPQSLDNLHVTELALENHDINRMDLVALLYQTGYLTIKQYDSDTDSYELAYPNLEVKRSFTSCILTSMAEMSEANQNTTITTLIKAIYANEYEKFFTILKRFFSAIPYQLHSPTEKYYHSLFYLIFHLIGYRVNAEVATHDGRIDAVMEFKNVILIFEFKLNQSASIALQQIHDKKYYAPYQNSSKKIILFGVNFDTTEKNITEWVSEEL